MSGNYSKVKTVVSGEIITAGDRNAEHDNHITNATPVGHDDYSATLAQMQADTDPYPSGSPSLSLSSAGEFERLRFQLRNIMGTNAAYWYYDPDVTLSTLKTGVVYSSEYTSLKAAIDAIGSASKTLILNSSVTTSNIAEAVTVPSNIDMWPRKSGIITKGSALSLTINGSVVGEPMHQWLSGFSAGNVILGAASVNFVSPLWTGLLTTASDAVNSTALAVAFAAAWHATARHKVIIPAGLYNYDTAIVNDWSYANLEGVGGGLYAVGDASPSSQGNTTILKYTGTGIGITLTAIGQTLRNFLLIGTNSAQGGISIGTPTDSCGSSLLENISVGDFLATNAWGLRITNSQINHYRNCSFVHNDYGVYQTGSSITTQQYTDCAFQSNHQYGLYEDGDSVGTTLVNPLIQGNYGDGVHIDNSLATNANQKGFKIYGGHVENNNINIAGSQIWVKGKSSSLRHYGIQILGTTFFAGGASMSSHLYLANTNGSFICPNWAGLTNHFINGSNNLDLWFGTETLLTSGNEGNPSAYMYLRNIGADRASFSLIKADLKTDTDRYLNLANSDIGPTVTKQDNIFLASADIIAGNTTLNMLTEGTGITLTGQPDVASTKRVKIYINGVLYTLLAE